MTDDCRARPEPETEARRRRHALAKDVLYAALDLEPEDRASFLHDACGGDAELRREVESLLAASGDPLPSRADGLPTHLDSDAPRLAPGLMVAGRYRVEALIGEGGMGQVYRVTDELIGETVALKRLRVRGPLHRRRLLEETRLARQVTHAGVCRVHDAGDLDGDTFVTMAFVDGTPLSRVLEQHAPLSSSRVIEVARALCEALSAMHAAGVLHGDLKPANIVVDAAGALHVVDFGLAKALGPTMTRGLAAGSPAYMAPEQLDPEGITDERTDLHALGLVLHECLTGQRAFRATTPADLLEQVRVQVPERPSLVVPGVDARLEGVIEGLLAKDPARRPASAADVLAQLEGRDAAPRIGTMAGRLPRPLTRLVGRTALLAEIRDLLEVHPLIALAGAGGCGKTRLAIEAARALEHGLDGAAWFVDLSALAEDQHVTNEVARAVGVRAQSAGDLTDEIARRLRRGTHLLVLDNCEHVRVAAARLVAGLLRAAPDLRILVTTREPLGCAGERIVAVPPLDVPAPATSVATLQAVESVELFTERARDCYPEFEVNARTAPFVESICRGLDGIPLALELAASSLRVLPLETLAQQVNERVLDLTSRDPLMPERHQTLRALVEWSHARLDSDAATLFRRLAAFAGGFTLADAEQVCGLPPLAPHRVQRVIATLADRSLIEVRRPRALERYSMLEPLRAFAADRLAAAGEEAAVRASHLRWFASLAESARVPLEGSSSLAWFERFEREVDNLRVALRFAAVAPATAADGLRMIVALWPFIANRRLIAEMRATLALLLAVAREGDSDAGDIAIGWACAVAGQAAAAAGATSAALDLLARARRLARAQQQPDLEALSLAWEGQALGDSGDIATGRERLEEACALARRAESARALALALNGLGSLELRAARGEQARQRYLEALDIARAAGLALLESRLLANLGIVDLETGNGRSGLRHAEASLEMETRLTGGTSLAVRVTLGTVCLVDGELERARDVFTAALQQARDECNPHAAASIAVNLTVVHVSRGDLVAARSVLFEALRDALRDGPPRGVVILAEQLARMRVRAGSSDDAARLAGATMAERERIQQPHADRTGTFWKEFMDDLREELGPRGDALAEEGAALGLRRVLEAILAA